MTEPSLNLLLVLVLAILWPSAPLSVRGAVAVALQRMIRPSRIRRLVRWV
jgi:hypothetical protein